MEAYDPPLNEGDIERYIFRSYLEKGWRYYRRGRVLKVLRRGNRLMALVRGSQPKPYRVAVLLGPEGIRDDYCSCPIGRRCMHVGALLLYWIYEGDKVKRLRDEHIEIFLRRQNKNALVRLILGMIERHPELEDFVRFFNP